MERWQNKVAVVTGASAGIGAAIAADLIKNGFIVVALARREERLRENQRALPANLQSRYHPRKCDVTNEQMVKESFAWIEKELGGADILISNAGIARLGFNLSALDNTKGIRDTVDTNIIATVYCVREAFHSMKNRNFDGHVVILNSVFGHILPHSPGVSLNMYPPSKFAVSAMVETYRQEFANAGTKIKVTSISPGTVETEFVPQMQKMKDAGRPLLNATDISNAILYCLSTPPHVQIHELIIKPIGEKF